ncbi:hypothetical protein PGT21_005814 [Puccinia graminis f. sp. tritici]|uniref:Uncharacterized protein n=1 Tax=Puccinia graminis f. sp. tritici TaxID=56615 RepID=A0A5B0NMT3_PUCGR|nr:hypothetical protein PGT21_005814 [Puccinia graminis f. sp. tritici]
MAPRLTVLLGLSCFVLIHIDADRLHCGTALPPEQRPSDEQQRPHNCVTSHPQLSPSQGSIKSLPAQDTAPARYARFRLSLVFDQNMKVNDRVAFVIY